MSQDLSASRPIFVSYLNLPGVASIIITRHDLGRAEKYLGRLCFESVNRIFNKSQVKTCHSGQVFLTVCQHPLTINTKLLISNHYQSYPCLFLDWEIGDAPKTPSGRAPPSAFSMLSTYLYDSIERSWLLHILIKTRDWKAYYGRILGVSLVYQGQNSLRKLFQSGLGIILSCLPFVSYPAGQTTQDLTNRDTTRTNGVTLPCFVVRGGGSMPLARCKKPALPGTVSPCHGSVLMPHIIARHSVLQKHDNPVHFPAALRVCHLWISTRGVSGGVLRRSYPERLYHCSRCEAVVWTRSASRINQPSDPFFGDQDFGQPGIILETAYGDDSPRWFMIYQNGIDFKPYRAMNVSCSA